MNRRQNQSSYRTQNYKLVIHLYRSYELPVAFSSESITLSSAMRRDLLDTILGHQADFLAKIAQLRHNYLNYITLISESDEQANHRGIFRNSLGWYQTKQPEYYERFKQLLLDIRNLLPVLPASQLELEDQGLIDKIRHFENEANSVIVNPVRNVG